MMLNEAEYVLDLKENFWTIYPQFKDIEPFKKFYKGNKDKESTSKMMWFISYCYHPKSIMFTAEEVYKLRVSSESILGDISYYNKHKEEIDLLIDAYKRTIYFPSLRALELLNRKMDERISYINNLSYSAETADLIDSMLSKFKGMFDSLEKIMKDVNKEVAKSGLSDALLSEADQGKM